MTHDTLPKSLHTVRILAAVAKDLITRQAIAADPETAVLAALRVCGYGDCTADPYGLRARAVAALIASMPATLRAVA